MSTFGSFSYFQTFLSLGVKQGLQKLPKFDINDRRLSFHCYILIPRKCPRKTPFKTQCGGGALVCLLYIIHYSLCSSTPTSPSGGQQAGSSLAPKESRSSKILSPKKSLLAAKESSSGRRLDKNIKQLFGARMTSKGMINIFPI